MADQDLEELRKQRLMQLQSQYKDSSQNTQQQEEQVRIQEAKNTLLSEILDQSARARLNTLMLGKPEKGKMMENLLINMAQSGQIHSKIGEQALIGLLENVSSRTQNKSSVNFDRRRAALDDDDDDLY